MKQIEPNSIHVLNYKNLKDFLKDYALHKKETDSTWSFASWAHHIGLESATSITMIINGQRNCGKNIEAALIKYFNFSEEELLHFKILVQKDKLQLSDPLRHALEKKILLNLPKKKIIELSDKQFSLINRWYYYTLRQLARIIPLKKDQNFLAHLFQNRNDIDYVDALDTLVQQGFLEPYENTFKPKDVVLSTTQNISSDSIKEYHEEVGRLGVEAIRKYDIQLRRFEACTLAFDKKNLELAHSLIEKFLDDFQVLADAQNGDSVYQMNIQFFPLAVIDEKPDTRCN